MQADRPKYHCPWQYDIVTLNKMESKAVKSVFLVTCLLNILYFLH